MSELDEIPSDEELSQATKDGTIREGLARIHYKLFPKYGFLIPENPLFAGETIFFGLTAHVDASRKYIADLREELYADQRVRYMAVPVERDGTIKWKALVVGPLPADEQEPEKTEGSADTSNEELWLTCTIHPNLQTTHGFATPHGANQYHDNVYFSLREASEGLKQTVTDLTSVFHPGEIIKALVVPADQRFKAKYRAIQVCKMSTAMKEDLQPMKVKTPNESDNEDGLVDENDVGAVTWIKDILESKGSMKLTSLTGDVSRNAEVRNVVQPQKKSVKRFLSKYPKFFAIKDGEVFPVPNCPTILSKRKDENASQSPQIDFNDDDKNSSSDDDTVSSIGSDPESVEASSPAVILNPGAPLFTNTSALKAFPDVSSPVTISMLATIINRYKSPMKMSEVYRLCQHHGWEGIKSVAMVAQIINSNPKYFLLDERKSVSLSTEGKKFISKQIGAENGNVIVGAVENGFGNIQKPTAIRGTQGSLVFPSLPSSARSAFASSAFVPQRNVARRIYTPIGTPVAANVGDPEAIKPRQTEIDTSFPTSSVLGNGFGPLSDDFYLSDVEDSFDEKFKPNKPSTPRCTEEESLFLSVVARAICPNAIGGREEVYGLLRKELEGMGVLQSDADSFGLSGILSRHLLCLQLDMDKRPRAKFQVFTPSGKINQVTRSLATVKVTEAALSVMLSQAHVQDKIIRVGRLLYGIEKTYHSIRMLTNGLDEVQGCTVGFKTQEQYDIRLSDLLQLGEKAKVKIILSDMKGTTSNAACCFLRRSSDERSPNSMVVVVDVEGQIFGFGRPTGDARRMICDSLDMQQRHLKESVHHQPNTVIVNAVDCIETLNLLDRIYARGINIFAEVARSLEPNVRNIFKNPM